MPIIRATVTIALAIPNDSRPAVSTAAVERGVTVSPKPSPKTASTSATSPSATPGVQRDIQSSAPADATSPTSVTSRSDR